LTRAVFQTVATSALNSARLKEGEVQTFSLILTTYPYLLPGRFRELYSHPPSDGSISRSPSPDGGMGRKLAPQARLQRLKAELKQLESDIVSANHANSTSSDDPETLLLGLTEIRERLNTLGSSAEMARTSQKLLFRVASSASPKTASAVPNGAMNNDTETREPVRTGQSTSEAEIISSLDRRLGELEISVGASNATLDEVGDFINFYKTSPVHPLSMPFHVVLPVAPAPPSTYHETLEYPDSPDSAKTNRRHLSTAQAVTNRS
jgi:hypothetical protein